MDDIPYGYCKCGCGQKTLICTHTRARYQQRAGEPLHFVRGHQNRHPRKVPPEERFWSRVEVRGPDECWLWKGGAKLNSYGGFCPKKEGTRYPVICSHVYAATLTYGPVPSGMQVNHHCDVRACCNPKHLYYGTQKENVRDAVRRERVKLGEKASWTRLTDAQVVEIYKLRQAGVRIDDISKAFKVAPSHVCEIGRGHARRPAVAAYLVSVQP